MVLLLATAGLIGEVAGSKPLPRGDSRTGDIIGAAVCFVIAAACVFWMVWAGRRLRARGRGADLGSVTLQPNTAARPDHHQLAGERSGHELGVGRRRRGRRAKPLSEMTAAEVRRAMWLLPVSMGAAVLAGVGRIAVAAIEEEMSLWLAGVLVVVFTAWAAAVTLRLRRRYRQRLSELRDPITGSFPDDAPAPPLLLVTRMWLVATPLLVGVAIVLVAVMPGNGDTCASKGIATSAAREGICQRGGNLFGGGTTYNVVDAGHTLSMPGYQARLLSTALAPITVEGPYATAALYPNHRGLLASFEIEVTNTGHQPLQLPITQAVTAQIPDAPGSPEGTQWFPSAGVTTAPTPQLYEQAALARDQSNTGWVSFILPPSIQPRLRFRFSDLEFYPADQDHDYIGQIRLWKAANAARNAALHFRYQP
jgi:hypothetical protein